MDIPLNQVRGPGGFSGLYLRDSNPRLYIMPSFFFFDGLFLFLSGMPATDRYQIAIAVSFESVAHRRRGGRERADLSASN